MTVNPFADLLKKRRKQAGYSQEGLGQKIRPFLSREYAKQYIWKLEAGVTLPLESDIPLLAKALRIEASELQAVVTAYRAETPNNAPIRVRLKTKYRGTKKPPKPVINRVTLGRLSSDKFVTTVNKILADRIKLVGDF